jgi:hypothetical protein
MKHADVVTLGEIAYHMKLAGLTLLQVGCKKCQRFGQYKIDRLVEKHGADMGLPAFRRFVAQDCHNKPCGVYYPQIQSTFRAEVI